MTTTTTTTSEEPLALPERAVLWRWVGQSLRPLVGWLLAALGALALFLGWYGVSGQSLTAKQLPYLVSGGLTGVGLVVLAAVFLATDDIRRQMRRLDEMERKVDDLYALLVTAAPDADGEAPAAGAAPAPVEAGAARRPARGATGAVALPNGSSYHRADCALVAGKPGAAAVTAAVVAKRGLRPCRVCEPDPPDGRRRPRSRTS